MTQDKVFVFVHDENGSAIGAGELKYTARRGDLAGTIAGLFGDHDRDANPADMMAVVLKAPGSLGYHVVPVTQISDFPDHPGYQREEQ